MENKKQKIELDYSLITDVEVDDIKTWDYPDFVDAFISSANYGDREMTDEELEVLNQDAGFVHEQVFKKLY
jgi:hypothetical protein